MHRAVWLACLTIVLAGCSSDDDAMSRAEAERVAASAVEALAADIEGGGDLRFLRADMDMVIPDIGAGSMALTIEWGLEGTSSIQAQVSTQGGSIEFAIECGTDRQVLQFAGERLEGRRDADCQDVFDGSGDFGSFDPTDLNDVELVTVTANADGSVNAVYDDDGYTLDMLIRDGRVISMDIDGPDGTGTIEFEYGDRRIIEPEPADERMPTSADAYCFYFDGHCETDVHDGDEAPLSEFQIRIFNASDHEAPPLATIPLSGGQDNGFTVTYLDDGDGRFGAGDSFTVTGPDQDVIVRVWDLWADKSIDDVGIPGPWLPLVALALLGAAFQRHTGKP